jgi:hypothetical protein
MRLEWKIHFLYSELLEVIVIDALASMVTWPYFCCCFCSLALILTSGMTKLFTKTARLASFLASLGQHHNLMGTQLCRGKYSVGNNQFKVLPDENLVLKCQCPFLHFGPWGVEVMAPHTWWCPCQSERCFAVINSNLEMWNSSYNDEKESWRRKNLKIILCDFDKFTQGLLIHFGPLPILKISISYTFRLLGPVI